MNSVLYEALQARGIPYPREEVSLNKFTRWGKNSRYWAVGFEGGYSFGDFARSERWETFEKNYDREKCKHEIRAVQKKLNEEKKREQAKAAIAAQREWSAAQNCESHPYLKKKARRVAWLKNRKRRAFDSAFRRKRQFGFSAKNLFRRARGKIRQKISQRIAD